MEFPRLHKYLPEMMEPKTLQSGSVLLREGQSNGRVYFLQEGTLSVFVQGERVAQIAEPGDAVGEMSIVTNDATAATVIADTDVELDCLNIENVADIISIESDQTLFMTELFKAFAVVLRRKLVTTNEKARQFELANRELIGARLKLVRHNDELETMVEARTSELIRQTREVETKNRALEERNTALTASHRKLEELNQTKEQILHKVGRIHNKHLTEMESLLNRIYQDPNAKGDVGLLQKALGELHVMQNQLKPIADMYFTEKAIRNKKVLLAEDEYKHQIVAKMALGGTGVSLDIVSDLEQGRSMIDQNCYDMVCTNGSLIELAVYANKKDADIKTVLISSEHISTYVEKLHAYPFITNIVTRRDDDKLFTLKSIVTTVSKTLSNDVFGLEKYLNWGVDVKQIPIVSSTGRKDIVVEMEDQLKRLGIKPTMIAKCALIAEELLMNAIYDAPTDPATGKSKYNHLSRTEKIVLEPQDQGFFRFGFDGITIAISAEDPHGAFHRKTVLDYLSVHLTGSPTRFAKRESKGGAGLGLYQILSTADLVVLNVKKKKRTEVIALLNVNPDRKKGRKMSSFHYFLA